MKLTVGYNNVCSIFDYVQIPLRDCECEKHLAWIMKCRFSTKVKSQLQAISTGMYIAMEKKT